MTLRNIYLKEYNCNHGIWGCYLLTFINLNKKTTNITWDEAILICIIIICKRKIILICYDSDLLSYSYTVTDGIVQPDQYSNLAHSKSLFSESTWSHLRIGCWAERGWNDSSCFPDGSETIIYWFIPKFSGHIDHWQCLSELSLHSHSHWLCKRFAVV